MLSISSAMLAASITDNSPARSRRLARPSKRRSLLCTRWDCEALPVSTLPTHIITTPKAELTGEAFAGKRHCPA
jgi:hypothetical protein